MSELAVNQYGKAFALPIEAKYWLVRKMSDVPRGGPVPTFDAAGRPIVISVETTMDQFHTHLRSQGCLPGRYRLDALDAAQSPVKDVIAYLPFPPVMGRVARATVVESDDDRPRNEVPAKAASVWSTGGPWPLPVPGHMTGVEYLLGEALRGQLEMHAATTSALVQVQAGMAGMMVAAAELMRAADGAGLPKRRPGVVREEPAPRAPQVIVQQVAPPVEAYDDEEDDGDDDPPEPPKPPGWQDKLAEVFSDLAPMAKVMIASKLGDMVSGGGNDGVAPVASVDAYRNAIPAAAMPPAPAVVQPESEEEEPDVDLSPAAWSHLQLVEMRLGPEQGQALREELDRMAPDVRRDFALALMSLKLDAACDHVVGQLAILDARRSRAQAAAQRATIRAEDARVEMGGDGQVAQFASPFATSTVAAAPIELGDEGDLDPRTAAALGLHSQTEFEVASPTEPAAETPVSVPPGYQVARIVRGKDGQRFAHLRPVHVTPVAVEGAAQANGHDAAAGGSAELGALMPTMTAESEAQEEAPHALGAMARLMEILPRLSPQERATAQSIAMSLPDPVRQGLLSKLVAVPLDEAVAVVKAIVAKHQARSS